MNGIPENCACKTQGNKTACRATCWLPFELCFLAAIFNLTLVESSFITWGGIEVSELAFRLQ